MRSPCVLSVVLGLATTGCIGMARPRASYEANPQNLALPNVVVYQGATGPMSYHASVGKDGERLLPTQRVTGRSCQRGIQIPLAAPLMAFDTLDGAPPALSAGWGEGAYRDAIDEARRGLPPGAVLFDVRADLQQKMILSVYREQCLVIDAGVLVPEAVAAAPATPVAATPEGAEPATEGGETTPPPPAPMPAAPGVTPPAPSTPPTSASEPPPQR